MRPTYQRLEARLAQHEDEGLRRTTLVSAARATRPCVKPSRRTKEQSLGAGDSSPLCARLFTKLAGSKGSLAIEPSHRDPTPLYMIARDTMVCARTGLRHLASASSACLCSAHQNGLLEAQGGDLLADALLEALLLLLHLLALALGLAGRVQRQGLRALPLALFPHSLLRACAVRGKRTKLLECMWLTFALMNDGVL